MTEVNIDSVRQFRLTKSTQLVLRALNLKLFSSIFLLLHLTCFLKDSFEKKVLKRKLWRRHFEKKVSKRMKRKCQILGKLVLYRVRPTIKIWWTFCGMNVDLTNISLSFDKTVLYRAKKHQIFIENKICWF